MKKYSIIFGLLTAVFFASSVFACDMPGMKKHSGPCKIEQKKQTKKSNESNKHNHK